MPLPAGMTGSPARAAETDDRYLSLTAPRPRVAPAPPAAAVQARPERRRANPGAVIVRDTPGRMAIDPSIFVLVIGDTLAESLAGGLTDAFADNPAVQVHSRTVAASGLVRTDFFDWRTSLRDLLASGEKVTHAVILLGSNDRQSIRQPSAEPLEALTTAWRDAYLRRIDELTAVFAERGIPVYWVGVPILENTRLAADMAALNELFRAAARRNGATFVDLWEPFADGQNRYAALGPDINGDTARLRTSDGVNLTARGARKAAHFVEVEIRRNLENRAPAIIAMPEGDADPASLDPALRPGGIERAIDTVVLRGLDGLPPLPIAIPTRPPAGPILPLTVPPSAADGRLVASPLAGRPTGDAGLLIERVITQGRPADQRPGRADDFTWPAAAN